MKKTALLHRHEGPSEKDQEEESFKGKAANKPLKSGTNARTSDTLAISRQD